jgi:hypothetical protein
MGRHDAFFMDDISVFRNPANVNIYPNMLMGSYGHYFQDSTLDATGRNNALVRYNRDPQEPFFGGILSYSLNQSVDAGDQYPMVSVGVVLNRHDPILDYVMPGTRTFTDVSQQLVDVQLEESGIDPDIPEPLGRIDVILGYALPNGGMIGAGGYTAFQEISSKGEITRESKVFQGNVGVNWPIAKTMDLEVSGGGAMLTGIGTAQTGTETDPEITKVTIAEREYTARAEVRLFSALRSLNGDFVPHFEFERVGLHNETSFMTVAAGLGLNLNIDRGFFWSGIEGLYEEARLKSSDDQTGIGARVGFGIERNMVWDWLLWRVSGMKKLLYVSQGEDSGSWSQNPTADGSDYDHVSLGFGFNLENRFKADFVVSEDIPYTATSIASGSLHHIVTRISATYSF